MRPAASTCASLGLGFGAVTDLRRLQYFVAVARERNFTRAAERLHIAQPALSRQVKQLEQELGVELLHRTTHEFQLTPAGRFLLERGPALLSAADELWRDVRGYGSGERGGVTVAYGASASYETAPRLVRVLTERHPGIAMTTAVKSVAEILSGLRDRSVDIGLVRCPPKGAGIDAQPVRMERQGVLLRRDHRLAANSTLTALDLAEETVLLHPREGNPGHYDAVLGLFREHALEPRVELRTLSFDLAYTPILQGGVITIIGESSTSIGLPDELCWVPLSPPVRLEVALLTRRHQRSPAVDRLLEAATIASRDLGWA